MRWTIKTLPFTTHLSVCTYVGMFFLDVIIILWLRISVNAYVNIKDAWVLTQELEFYFALA